ncbi:MAG: SurA N-terminal domain-containing protein [Desulfobacterales bacterium]
MLNTMRKNAGSWMIKVLLFAIVVVFIFWGVGTFREQRSGRLAIVNGESITYDEWAKTYNSMVENLRQQFGENFNDDMLKVLNVKEQALNQLINNRLLLEEAKRLNFRVGQQELVDAIRSIPAFQTDGVFNPRLYRRVLSHFRMTPEEFESIQRSEILVGKLRTFINQTANVSDEEALEWYQWNRASVNIDYVLFETDTYTHINPSEEEIRKHFEENKGSYAIPPTRKVQYLDLDPIELRSKATVTDEETAVYFEEHPEEFVQPKTVEASHILLKLTPDAEPESVEKKRKEAIEIMEMAKGGKDFAELAKTYSEGPTKASGGYLGTFEKNEMVAPFAEKAFSMHAGEISEPVRTRFGWHIIRVEKINEEGSKTFEEVKGEIREKLEMQYAEQMAYDQAELIFESALETGDLAQTAENHNLKIHTTDFFPKSGPKTGIANPEEFASVAFDLEIMDISDIFRIDEAFFILQPIESRNERIPEFAAVKKSVKEDLIEKRQAEAALKDAEKLLAELEDGFSESRNAETDIPPAFQSTGFFNRFGPIPDIGYEKEVIEAAFKLTPENPYPDRAIEGSEGFYVIRLEERKEPDKQGFENEKDEIKETLISQKQSKTFDSLIDYLKNKSEISIKDDFYQL